MKVYFNSKDNFDDTALHIAVNWGTARSVDKLLKTIAEKFTDNEQKSLFFAKGAYGKNVLGHAALNSDVMVIRCVWETATKLMGVNDIKRLLCDTDDAYQYAMNLFQQAALNNNPFVLNILEWFKVNFGIDELLIVLRKEANEQTILLQIVAQYCDKKIIERFFEYLRLTLNLSEIKEMIFRKGSEGYNSLGYLVHNRDEHSVEVFWSNVKILFSPDELELLVF